MGARTIGGAIWSVQHRASLPIGQDVGDEGALNRNIY